MEQTNIQEKHHFVEKSDLRQGKFTAQLGCLTNFYDGVSEADKVDSLEETPTAIPPTTPIPANIHEQ